MEHLALIAVLGLAAYRATQLVVWDTIADPIRTRIELWHAARHDSRFRSFVRDLIGCTYCAGFWLSCITVLAFVYGVADHGQPIWLTAVDCWSVAGVQALLNRWDDSRPGHQG